MFHLVPVQKNVLFWEKFARVDDCATADWSLFRQNKTLFYCRQTSLTTHIITKSNKTPCALYFLSGLVVKYN